MPKNQILVPNTQGLAARRGRIGNFVEEFLETLSLDMVRVFDDFEGDQVPFDATAPGKYTTITGVDGTFAIEDTRQALGGIVTASPSVGVGADAEYVGVSLVGPTATFSPTFRGDNNCVMAARVTLDVVASTKVEIGWTDAYNDAGAVNSLAGNTFTATDAAVWCYDTADNTLWQGCGVQTGTAITKVEPTASELAGPVATTYQTMIVAIRTNAVKFISLNAAGNKVYESGWQASGIEGGTLITPWVFVQLRSGVDRHLDIDYIAAWQRRSTSN